MSEERITVGVTEEADRSVALRRVRGRTLALAAVPFAALAASSFVPAEHPAQAALPISREVKAAIGEMSTGGDQAIVVTGENAVERNATIPLTTMPRGQLARFTQVAPGRAGYATALKCLTQAIYYEAANEPESGKLGVAQVVLNRVRHPAYPSSVCGVVYEGANDPVCQFSFTCDGSLLRAPLPRQWAESERVAREALSGKTEAEVGAATNYHADYVVPRWAFTLGKLGQIGRHIFYRLPGRLGDARVFTEAWSGNERIPAIDFDRLRVRLAARDDQPGTSAIAPAEQYVPGLTVMPDVKDRHAPSDVGGRLDTTTGFQLAIPDPTQASGNYRRALEGQGDQSQVANSPTVAEKTGHAPELSLAAPAPGARN
ncbi:cell wall hydrolase [Tsuneonella mangrovi]|uniref:cell wall hydrolase n=1 Tax=Tsuneonella mangrovi TaxID=1982042 RepID=UPI001F0A2D2E|nr:cell wall hydrolase [Tsuneonella mangrovi]